MAPRRSTVRVPRLPVTKSSVPRDQHGLNEAAITDFANELGYKPDGLWYWWGQIAAAVEMHTGFPRGMCEHIALCCVRESFDQRGRAAS